MKKVLTALALFVVLGTFAQPFEGEIVFESTVKSKMPGMPGMVGTDQHYFIKNGNYKSMAKGGLVEWQVYINAENKIYTKMKDSDTVLWNDASINRDPILKSELKKNVTRILGYSCDELTFTCKSGIHKHYFSSELPVDITLFERHKFANWYDYLSRSKSVSLKTVYETRDYLVETVAKEIKPMKLESSVFTLPPGVKTKKNPN